MRRRERGRADTGAASQRAAASSAPAFGGAQDPHTRAQRLARALASDIAARDPQRRDRSLGAGTLRSDFREEILRSWDEYVAQVGPDLAERTPYFRDALNAVLAKGRKLF